MRKVEEMNGEGIVELNERVNSLVRLSMYVTEV